MPSLGRDNAANSDLILGKKPNLSTLCRLGGGEPWVCWPKESPIKQYRSGMPTIAWLRTECQRLFGNSQALAVWGCPG